MSAITFEVIDQACEATNRTFFPPQVTLVAVSTTVVGTLLGFPEYGSFASNPPKKYHSLAWTGTSEQQLWYQGVQIGGAKFAYSGTSTIDSHGNYTSTYTKELSEECTAADDLVTNITSGLSGTFGYSFKGWCGPSGHQKCSPCNLPYLDQGDVGIKRGDAAIFDVSFFWGSSVNALNGVGISNFVQQSAVSGSCVDSGTVTIPSLFDPVPTNVAFNPSLTFPGQIIFTHNYSSLLSNEYTEAEALANGTTYTGNGTVALYIRSGFTVTQTSVSFNLNFTRLISGQNYVASYQLWDSATGATTNVSLPFTAPATTFTISGTIPTPATGHTTQIRFPTVAFA